MQIQAFSSPRRNKGPARSIPHISKTEASFTLSSGKGATAESILRPAKRRHFTLLEITDLIALRPPRIQLCSRRMLISSCTPAWQCVTCLSQISLFTTVCSEVKITGHRNSKVSCRRTNFVLILINPLSTYGFKEASRLSPIPSKTLLAQV